MGELFTIIFKNPTINLLLFFYQLFLLIRLPGAFGFAIIALTTSIRLLLHPFFKQQIELSNRMSLVKPHLDKLAEKHKNDKKKLQEEQLKLYKEMGINPASGCIFAIIQMPVFIALYQVLFDFFDKQRNLAQVIAGINKLVYFPFLKIHSIDPNFFGLNLAIPPSQYQKYGFYYLAIPVITAVLQYFQASVATPVKVEKKQTQDKKDKKEDSEDMQKIMSTQMKFMFPLMIGIFSYQLPIGLSLYWNIFSIFSIMQYQKSKVNPQADR
jgi:YidC/Oxa1 family membrane protein insertase